LRCLRRPVEDCGKEVGAAAGGADLRDDLGPALLAAACGGDVRALGGERCGDGPADIAGRAGDEGCLAR